MAETNWGEIYKELGAKPIINAIGSVTMLGGSTPAQKSKRRWRRRISPTFRLWNLKRKQAK